MEPTKAPGIESAGSETGRTKSPLLLVSASFALGIFLTGSRHANWFVLSALPAAVGICLVAGLLLLRAGWQRVSLLLALAGFLAAGASAGFLFEYRFPPNHVSKLAARGIDLEDPIRLEGRVVSTPARTSYGLQFDLEAERAEGRERSYKLTGRVRLRLETSEAGGLSALRGSGGLQYGDAIRALVRLRRPRVYQNPGSFDFRRWMESTEDIYWVGTIKNPLLIEKLPRSRPPGIWVRVERIRQSLLRSIDDLYPPWSAQERCGTVLKAVLLGDRSSLDSETIENFRKTGLYHLLVIAGLHVGLLVLLASALLSLVRISDSSKCLIVLALLVFYSLLVQQRAPTLRATLMISIYLLARVLYRGHSTLNAVGLAGLILLLVRPAWLFESGFQLSFSAALLIAGLVGPILERTTEPYRRAVRDLDETGLDAWLPPQQAQFRLDLRALGAGLRKRFRFLDRHGALASAAVTGPTRLLLWTANILLFSAVLQVGLLLPMATSFHRVALAGIGFNALAIPLMTLLLALAVPTVLLGVFLPAVAAWPAKALAAVMATLFALTDLPHLPAWLSFRVPNPPLWVGFGFVLSILLAGLSLAARRTAAAPSPGSSADGRPRPQRAEGQGSEEVSPGSFLGEGNPAGTPSPGPLRLEKAPAAVHPLPQGEERGETLSSCPLPKKGEGSETLSSCPLPKGGEGSETLNSCPPPKECEGSETLNSCPVPKGDEGSEILNSCPLPLGGEGGARRRVRGFLDQRVVQSPVGVRVWVFWLALATLALMTALLALHPFPPRLPPRVLEVTALDCGQGDALFLVLPDRITMLVDASGSRQHSASEGAFQGRLWDPGEDIVSPYLWSRGIKRIDVVALSHPHEDHLGGLFAVLRNFRVGEFWHAANSPSPAYSRLLELVRERGVAERTLAAGDVLELGGAVVRALWPARRRRPSDLPSNDDSLVLRVTYHGESVLLTGDISAKVERQLLASGEDLQSEVLKVAHHGSNTSSSGEFLARVNPRLAILTGGSSEFGNLPSPEALERLRERGIRVFRPDLEGATTVELDGGLQVTTFHP